MAFGAQIQNQNGNQIIVGSEESYLHAQTINWSYTANAGSNYGGTHDFVNTILAASNPIAFTTVNSSGGSPNFAASVEPTGSGWRLRISGRNFHSSQGGTVNGTALVFVEARYVPLPNYGVQLINDSNVTAFHNGNQALLIDRISAQDGTAGGIFPVDMQDQRADRGTQAYYVDGQLVITNLNLNPIRCAGWVTGRYPVIDPTNY